MDHRIADNKSSTNRNAKALSTSNERPSAASAVVRLRVDEPVYWHLFRQQRGDFVRMERGIVFA
jgi:hypothetical protein